MRAIKSFYFSTMVRKYPAQSSQLVDLRKFNEELRSALGVPTYYNEALGSTCRITAYDRVKGRKGDVPDKDMPERAAKTRPTALP